MRAGVARRLCRHVGAWAAALLVLAVIMAPARALEVGDTVQLPAVQLLDGRTLPPSHWAGKPVVVQIWASWCPYCALQNPRLQKLYDATRGTRLQFLTISIDRRPDDAIRYLRERGYTFPAAMDTPALRAAIGGRKGLPELYVIDANGKVVQKEVGEMLEEEVAALARYATP